MPNYRRPRVPGASVFATVCLARRGSWLLVEEVARLRTAVRATLAERLVGVAAWVVLPDHMHFVWDLPEGDSDYAVRIGAMKARFSASLRRDCRRSGFSPTSFDGGTGGVGLKPDLRWGDGRATRRPLGRPRAERREAGIWQRRFYEHHLRGEEERAAAVAYCDRNPARHGLVEDARDWPFSTAWRGRGERRAPVRWDGTFAIGSEADERA
ncbi:putative transposase [Hasllibacter halocynthiae]|uniref:Putative transposase n=1 Tax=Hasllibacter halocynthiae TaxID=595589 RepID=A0A2T0X484_9RHOB|nr:transposase [Hasllibacter halocynthiae]PRY93752.1 putative transposase [Hasllibacter halocynthiae]